MDAGVRGPLFGQILPIRLFGFCTSLYRIRGPLARDSVSRSVHRRAHPIAGVARGRYRHGLERSRVMDWSSGWILHDVFCIGMSDSCDICRVWSWTRVLSLLASNIAVASVEYGHGLECGIYTTFS
jgi:hypothetical protein